MTTEIFTTSGSWTRPDGVRSVYVEAWGAGGDGAASDGTFPGGGGGGGGFSAATLSIDSNADVTVTVPTGSGGNASFGSALEAYGGQNAQGFNGGSGGFGGTGSTNNYGGAGAPYSGDDAGGGGGGASSTQNGGDADGHQGGSGGTSGGGNGGDGSWLGDPDHHGENGLAPGGGGGGGRPPDGQGGLGARGEVRVTYTPGYLAWTTQPASGVYYEDQVINTVAVTVRTADHATDTLARENVTLQKITGPGILTGTTAKTPVNGVASFDDLVITEGGWHQLRAESTGAEGWPESGDSQSFEILVTQETIDAFGQSMAAQGSIGSASRLNDLAALTAAASSAFVLATRVVALQGASGTASGEEGEGVRSPAMTGMAVLASTVRSECEVIAVSEVFADARLWSVHRAGALPDLFEVHEIAGASQRSADSEAAMLSRFDLGGAAVRTHYTGSQALGLPPATARSWSITTLAAAPHVSADMDGRENSAAGSAGDMSATVHGTGQTMPATWTASLPEALAHLYGSEPSTVWGNGAMEMLSRAEVATPTMVWAGSQLAAACEMQAADHAANSAHAPAQVVSQADGAVLVSTAAGSDGDCRTDLAGSVLVADPAGVMAAGLVALDGRAQVLASSGWWGVSRPVVYQDVRYTLTCRAAARYRITVAPAARYRLGLGRTG